MTSEQATSFGAMLRHYRVAAGLTQEQLAERADLSVRAISDLERDAHRSPHRETAGLLATALDLSAQDRAALIGAVPPQRRRPRAAPPQRRQPGAVPLPPAPLIGREAEVAALTALLRRPETRLVTLTGAPGVGKTCLALQVAAQLAAHFADGAFFVPLAAIRDARHVASTIAQTVGLKEEGATPPAESLVTYLSAKQTLLLLDNFEQVIGAASLLAELRAMCPRLTLFVTSQAALRLRSEQCIPVLPLALPDPATVIDVAALTASPAVALFVQRAQAVDPGFHLTPATAPAVVGICRALDGLPLAIELAAARGKLFSPQALLTRLGHRLELLTAGARDLPPRQQSLRAALSWSYDLLHAGEQALVQRLAVFVGGSTLEAIEAVCAPSGAEATSVARADGDLLAWLSGLLDKSLLRCEEAEDGEPRFWMLETIREFGLERLKESGEALEVRRRHTAYYLALAERAELALRGPEQQTWLTRLERELPNLRAVLRRAQRQRELEPGLRLAGALRPFWEDQGRLGEGQDWLEDLLALEETGQAPVAPAAARARALATAGSLAVLLGDFVRAVPRLEQGLELYRALGDQAGCAFALRGLGAVARHRADYARATPLYQDSLRLYTELDDAAGRAETLHHLGLLASWMGDAARAQALHEESLSLHRALGDQDGLADALNGLGDVARHRGDYHRSIALLEESVALRRDMGDKQGLARTLSSLGHPLRETGAYAYASAVYGESLDLSRGLSHTWGIAQALRGRGHVARYQGDYEEAIARFEESRALYSQFGHTRGVAFVLNGLGLVACEQGDDARAMDLCARSLAIFRAQENLVQMPEALIALGLIARLRGEVERAAARFVESLSLARRFDLLWFALLSLEGLAAIAGLRGQAARAARLCAAVEAQSARTGARLPPADRARFEYTIASARAALGEASFAAAWSAGAAFSLERARAEALEDTIELPEEERHHYAAYMSTQGR